jgi:hypothetical protein
MLAHPAGREPQRPIARSTGVRLGRLATVLAALTGAVLASAAAIPVARRGHWSRAQEGSTGPLS